MLLNACPPKIGPFTTYSPRTIMTGKTLDCNKMCKVPFCEYVQVHEDRNIMIKMRERTQGWICLSPMRNVQGTYNFLLLRTGKKITRGQCTELPTPTIVMKRVAAMTLAEDQTEGLVF